MSVKSIVHEFERQQLMVAVKQNAQIAAAKIKPLPEKRIGNLSLDPLSKSLEQIFERHIIHKIYILVSCDIGKFYF